MTAFAELAALFGVPEYVLSFFLASIGTSLPELVVVLGSSFVDTTLSIGIGPALFPTSVTAALATAGSTTAIGVMGLVALLMGLSRRHNRVSGAALIALYFGVYYVMLA